MLKLGLYVFFTIVVAAGLAFCLRTGRFSYRGLTGSRTGTPERYWAVVAFLVLLTVAGGWSTYRLAQVVLDA